MDKCSQPGDVTNSPRIGRGARFGIASLGPGSGAGCIRVSGSHEGDRGTRTRGAMLTGLGPGSGLCEVELPNTLRRKGHVHATAPQYRPHAGNGPLRPSVAPGEDYAAPQTSQTPAACRCRAQIAAGIGPFARRPAHPWREPGGSAVLPRRPASRPLPDLRRMYSAAGSGPRVPRSRHHRVPCRTVFRTEASCPLRRSPSTVTTEENGH